MKPCPLQGLVAATHTPFHADRSLNLAPVEQQATLLSRWGVRAVFIAGTTGESHSLTLDERLALTQRWIDVTRNTPLQVIVHVGANCLHDAATLARHAQSSGALAISALAPSYFKPRSVDTLVDCCAQIASAAPDLPFFFYDIPGFTGVSLSMPDFLSRAPDKIPTLAGLKFTNPDSMMFQQCLRHSNRAFSVLWGADEVLLAGLALGATGAVGSTYNFAAPIYHRLIRAFHQSDWTTARSEQLRSVDLVAALSTFGYLPAARATMEFLGIPVGPARLPHSTLTDAQRQSLRATLESLGFFEWIQA